VPHDSKDDVVEMFLSKILPGSGTVYRSEHHQTSDDRTVSSTAAGTGSTPPTVVRQTANGTPADTSIRSPVATPDAAPLHETKHVVCKMVAIEITSDENYSGAVPMKEVCRHVSGDTALPGAL